MIYTGSSYAGSALTTVLQKIPDWTTVDLGLRYATALGDKPVTLRASVTNIADSHYWIVNPNGALILGPPRTVWLAAFDY